MELGSYIDYQLKKRGTTKKWLYDVLRASFEEPLFRCAFNTFTTKLNANTLSAIELLAIAAVMNLDLNQLVTYQTKQMRSIEKEKQRALPSVEMDLSCEIRERIYRACYAAQHPILKDDSRLVHRTIRIIPRKDGNYYVISLLAEIPTPQREGQVVCTLECIDMEAELLTLTAEYRGGIQPSLRVFVEQSLQHEGLNDKQLHDLAQLIEEIGAEWAVLFPNRHSYAAHAITNQLEEKERANGSDLMGYSVKVQSEATLSTSVDDSEPFDAFKHLFLHDD